MARILIVDDDPVNRDLLNAYLDGEGHELVETSSGEEAIRLAEATPPDLVLLDVMMGGLDGFETARQLKERIHDGFLPIVFLTALSDRASRVRALELGADEFLTKPVDRIELGFRVRNLLTLREKDQALRARNEELADLLRFRDEMSSLIVHDLKNPMSVILANYEYAVSQSRNTDPEYMSALQDSWNASRRMMRLLANLLDVARLEERRLQLQRGPVSPRRMLAEIASQRSLVAEARRVSIRLQPGEEVRIDADADLLTRVFENIFDNALRYVTDGGRIVAGVERTDSGLRVHIANTGAPVPVEHRKTIFEKYSRLEAGQTKLNMGLGLYFCRLVAEAHGGRISVEETSDLPTVFVVDLPS